MGSASRRSFEGPCPRPAAAPAHFGPPSPLLRVLADTFEGCTIRRQRHARFDLFFVERGRPEEFRLAVPRPLLQRVDEAELAARLVRQGVLDRLAHSPGRIVWAAPPVRRSTPAGRPRRSPARPRASAG